MDYRPNKKRTARNIKKVIQLLHEKNYEGKLKRMSFSKYRSVNFAAANPVGFGRENIGNNTIMIGRRSKYRCSLLIYKWYRYKQFHRMCKRNPRSARNIMVYKSLNNNWRG
jgi:hypothetical protein